MRSNSENRGVGSKTGCNPALNHAEFSRVGPRLRLGLALLLFALPPAVLCQLRAPPPRDLCLHVESFRYGKDPSVIRCHRGDRLHLTFSTRDTAHSFFLEELDLDAKISPGSDEVDLVRPSDPGAPPGRTREVVLEARHPGWLGWLVSKSQFRCHVWCGPMHAFEHGNLILEPNTLLHAALGCLLGIPLLGLWSLRGTRSGRRPAPPPVAATDGQDLFRSLPWLKRLLRWRGFQFACVALAMALFCAVLLTASLGTRMAGRNLGSMLTWIVWLFVLVAVLVPFGGRLWCLACPLPFLGETLQRGALVGVRRGSMGLSRNRFFGLNRRWPRWLANAWPRTVIFLALGTFSTVLVASPRASAAVLAGMALVALALSLVWELRAFCRDLCPINAFVGLYSMAGKLAVRATDATVCGDCTVHTCLTGNARGWACPYGLCIGEVNENNDCGMCTECIKTCAHDNVTLRWRPLAHEIRVRTASEAFQAMAMLTLGAAYCVVHLGHWPAIRDCVNVLDKDNWVLFGLFAAVLWTVALAGLPAVLYLLSWAGKRLSASEKRTSNLLVASTGALVPLGLFLWIAFVVPMLSANASFVAQSLSDPFGWGWDLFGARSAPWRQLWPEAVPWMQVACVLTGLHYSLRNAWRIWLGLTLEPRKALRGMLPLAAFLLALAAGLLLFFAD